MLADQFNQIFREEHRAVRDSLLDLIVAFQERDRGEVQKLLGRIAADTGPHFRYEEEALYPALVEIFGEEYIEKLLRDHDAAIATAGRLVKLAHKDKLTDGEVSEAIRLVRTILPHVSDCEGLSIMVERLPEEKVEATLRARERFLKEGMDLLSWAEQVRSRPAAIA